MNYYPFHIGDYAAHAGHLDPMEDIAYRRLLDAYYLAEGPLPSGVEACARLIRMRDQGAIVEAVLREFFVLTDDGWRSGRCDVEIQRKQEKADKARTSAGQRWHSEGNATAMRPHSEGNAPNSQEPITKKAEKKERAFARPAEVEAAHWDDWLAARKSKRAGAVNATVMAGMQREAAKAGIPLDDAVRICAEKSWIAFDASWNWQANARASPFVTAADRRDAETAEFLSNLTGGLAGNRKEPAHVIDAPRLTRPRD